MYVVHISICIHIACILHMLPRMNRSLMCRPGGLLLGMPLELLVRLECLICGCMPC